MIPDEAVLAGLLAGIIAAVSFVAGVAVTLATIGVRSTKRRLRDAEPDRRTWPADRVTWRGRASVPAELEETGRIAGSGLPPRDFGLTDEPLLTVAPTVAERDATALAADFPPPANVDPVVERMISDSHYDPQPDDLDRFIAEESAEDPAFAEALRAVDVFAAEMRQPDEVTRPDLAAALEMQTEVLASIREEEPDEDEPGDDPPAGGGGEPLCAEVVSPRYRPETPAEPWPPWLGVLHAGRQRPAVKVRRMGYLAVPIRVQRRYSRLRVWLPTLVPGPLRRAWDAAHELDPRGWAPGEAASLVGRHRAERVRPHRSLRPGWRSRLEIDVPSFPGWGCAP